HLRGLQRFLALDRQLVESHVRVYPWYPRGESVLSARRRSYSSFSAAVSSAGIMMRTVTSSSPAPPPLSRGIPYPGSRNLRWLDVAGGIFMETLPRSVGTSMVAPSATSGAVMGSVRWRSSPLRSNCGCGATETTRYRSPRPPVPPPPSPDTRTFWPVRTPAGMRTSTSRRTRCQPVPWQVAHGLPSPLTLPWPGAHRPAIYHAIDLCLSCDGSTTMN